jgi:hypothetical protein
MTRTDVAAVILEGYYSRMGQRALGNRARLKQQFFDALLAGLTQGEADMLARTLADRFHVSVTEGNPQATIKRVLDAVFGTGG